MNETNVVIEKLQSIIDSAASTYVEVGKSTMRLTDPDVPVKVARKFVKNRLDELG